MSYGYYTRICLNCGHGFRTYVIYVLFYIVFIFCLIFYKEFGVNLKCLQSLWIHIKKLLLVFTICLNFVDLSSEEHREQAANC